LAFAPSSLIKVRRRLLFGTADKLHSKIHHIFGACAELRLLIGIAGVLHLENLLYLALVLNLVFFWLFRCAELQKILIFGVCVALRLLFGTADKLHCKIHLIFGACAELLLLFGTFDVQNCKKTLMFDTVVDTPLFLALAISCIAKVLIFGACAQLRILFGTANVLHCKIHLQICACAELLLLIGTPIVLHVENLLYFALVLNCVFYLHCR